MAAHPGDPRVFEGGVIHVSSPSRNLTTRAGYGCLDKQDWKPMGLFSVGESPIQRRKGTGGVFGAVPRRARTRQVQTLF